MSSLWGPASQHLTENVACHVQSSIVVGQANIWMNKWRLISLDCSEGVPLAFLKPTYSPVLTWQSGSSASLLLSLMLEFFFFNVVDLQWCVSFRCTAKWFRYIYMCVCVCVYICSFSDSFPSWLLQNVEYSSLCCAVGPGQLSIRMLLSFMFCFSLLRASKSQFFFSEFLF